MGPPDTATRARHAKGAVGASSPAHGDVFGARVQREPLTSTHTATCRAQLPKPPQQAAGGAAPRDASCAPERLRDGVQRAGRSVLRPGRAMGASGRVGESSRSRLCHVACKEGRWAGRRKNRKKSENSKWCFFDGAWPVGHGCVPRKLSDRKIRPGRPPTCQIGQLWLLPHVAAGDVAESRQERLMRSGPRADLASGSVRGRARRSGGPGC